MEEDLRKSGLFYGWIVTGAGMVMAVLGLGIRYSYGVFIKSLESDFAISRGATSTIFSLYMILCCFLAVAGGWALDRFGPRKVGFVMACFTGAALLVTSRSSTLWQLFLGNGLLLSLGTGPVYTVVNSTASRWFNKKRGLAVGITTSGGGVGAIVIAPLAAYLLSSYGWRNCMLILGVMAWVIMAGMALLMKKEPGEMGLFPDGSQPKDPETSPVRRTDGDRTRNLSFLQAVGLPQFWFLGTTWLFLSLSIHMVFVHVVPYAVDAGISPMQAAVILGLIGASNIPGRILVGRASDAVGRKTLAVACALAQFCSLLWLMWARDLWSLYTFGIAFGFLWAGSTTMVTVIISDIFGTRNLGLIMGVLSAGWAIGAALGPAIAGFLFDVSGSYFIAFGAGATASLLGALSIIPIKRAV